METIAGEVRDKTVSSFKSSYEEWKQAWGEAGCRLYFSFKSSYEEWKQHFRLADKAGRAPLNLPMRNGNKGQMQINV